MIYRLYIVWGRNWKVIILPSILTTALVGSGSGVVYSFSRLNRGQDIFNSSAGHLVITVFVTTLTTNISVASLISYRIWSIRRSTASTGLQTLTPIIHVILDSAFIYTFFLILTHAGYLAKDTYQFISLDMTSPAIGIAFSLIIVRLV
ncbi:hypothetical protein BD779DRAFT_666003 [Infundibulicybe gibba]|nr:hypothetical protein BD779DRAFT_666003 [Infundibulicybe gibba]